jgi:hypothetical protein
MLFCILLKNLWVFGKIMIKNVNRLAPSFLMLYGVFISYKSSMLP